MLLWLSFSGTVLAKDIGLDKLYAYSNGNTITLRTPPLLRSGFHPNPTDWIGIYKIGDSNAWSNVKLWVWAKDFKEIEEGYGDYDYVFENINLPSAHYEARYFLNNSYTTEFKSEPFIVPSDEIHGDYNSKENSLDVEVRNKNFNPNPKDWIGIYKADDSNDWKNVRAWVWAKDLKKNHNNIYHHKFKNPDIHSGEYEIRYFLNNTFKTHKQSKSFKVQTNNDTNLYGNHNKHDKTTYIEIRDENFKPNPKDWFGVYKVGDSNDWSNVKLWVWAKDLKKSPPGYYYQFENSNLSEWNKYEVRYFLNNTFITNKTSKPFRGDGRRQ